jgi:hypothetical protein
MLKYNMYIHKYFLGKESKLKRFWKPVQRGKKSAKFSAEL